MSSPSTTDAGGGDPDVPTPRVLVINLDDEPGRFRSISSQLESLGLSCRRVAAVDGSRLSKAERDAAYSPALNARTYYKELSPGEIGAYLSHIEAWSTIVDDGLEHAVILEDDAVVDTSFPELGQLLARLRDWDYLKLTGPRGNKRIRDAVPLGARHRLVRYDKVPTGAYAQVVSRRGAQRLLASSRPFGRPVDVDLQHPWEKDIHVLGIEPAMVGHDPAFPSAITSRAGGTGRQRRSSFLRRLRFRLRYEWRVRTRSRPDLESFLEP